MFVFLQETVFQPHIWQLLKPRLYVLEYKTHLHVKTMQMFRVLSGRASFLVTPEQKPSLGVGFCSVCCSSGAALHGFTWKRKNSLTCKIHVRVQQIVFVNIFLH